LEDSISSSEHCPHQNKPKPTANDQTQLLVKGKREMLNGMQIFIYSRCCSLSDHSGLDCLGNFLQRSLVEVVVCFFPYSALVRKHFLLEIIESSFFE